MKKIVIRAILSLSLFLFIFVIYFSSLGLKQINLIQKLYHKLIK